MSRAAGSLWLSAAARSEWTRAGVAVAGAAFALLVPYALVAHGVDLFLVADGGLATGLLFGAFAVQAPGRRAGLAAAGAGFAAAAWPAETG